MLDGVFDVQDYPCGSSANEKDTWNSVRFIVQVPKIVQFCQTSEMNWISCNKCWNHKKKKIKKNTTTLQVSLRL